MDVGLLWFDNDARRGVEEKVQRAVAHYVSKYGHRPNVCFVHPSMLDGNGNGNGKQEDVLRTDGVEVRVGRAILPNHFWIGVTTQ